MKLREYIPAEGDAEHLAARLIVSLPTNCHVWCSSTSRDGYGEFRRARGRQWYAHRVAWTLSRGPIPDGVLVLHRCDNPPCCNPDHLYLGTMRENMRDREDRLRNPRALKNRTHCSRGHLLSEVGTVTKTNGRGPVLRCRECVREDARVYDRQRTRGDRRAA